MTRYLRFLLTGAASIVVGFAAAILVSGQVAQADVKHNGQDRLSHSCKVNNAPCENYTFYGQAICESIDGNYPKENFWDKAPAPNLHSVLSANFELCAEVWKCEWSGGFCVKSDTQKTPKMQQIYVTTTCKQT
jgi:hypothetical protein